MNNTLALVLNLSELSLFDSATPSPFTLVSQEALVADTFAELLSQQELQQTQDMLMRLQSGNLGAAAAFSAFNDLTHTINDKGIQAQQFAVQSTLQSALEDVRRLRRTLGSQLVEHIDVRLNNLALFRYIQSLTIEPAQGHPTTRIVGTLPQELVPFPFTVSPTNNSQIERRTEIVYRPTSSYPFLNVKLRSRRSSGDMKNELLEWPQYPFPSHDLEVCMFNERPLGRIQTRQRDLPYTIAGKSLTLVLPQAAHTSLVETSILDPQEKLLFRCVRVITPREALPRDI